MAIANRSNKLECTRPWETVSWKKLSKLANDLKSNEPRLGDWLGDAERCSRMRIEFDGVLLDYSRQKLDDVISEALFDLAKEVQLETKIQRMANAHTINSTEGRAVLHVALRASRDQVIQFEGVNVVDQVHEILDLVYTFAEKVRSGAHRGATGKKLINTVSIGIGGSYLGPEFVVEALKMEPTAALNAVGRTIKFLANVDPVDLARALDGLDPTETLVIVTSKTFTTAESMLNARTVKRWFEQAADKLGVDRKAMVAQHMVAVSCNDSATESFGIEKQNVFKFWDWVGGRYSVCSSVGILPLALQYGSDICRQFLLGAHEMDVHFTTAPFEKNLPIVLGLCGVWNSTFMGYGVRALLPYSQALHRFPAHIQQVDMESNGKRVSVEGEVLPFEAGEIDFGEPGTNGQHSFYQLIHQGRVCPCDFIGAKRSQVPTDGTAEGEQVSNHDELMSNFFAQPDALAMGKTAKELRSEGVAEDLIPHKEFTGDRPSTCILFPYFDARRIGQLLSLYEHRTAVQGFVWNINSFDQWGVELGKSLAKKVRSQLRESRTIGAEVNGFNPSTTYMLNMYLQE